MNIPKDKNQYYGAFFEQAIVSLINKVEIINSTGYDFPEGDLTKMINDASILVESSFKHSKQAIRIGSATVKANADILVDGIEYEVKYVSGGKGTHYNTSTDYTEKLGYSSYSKLLKISGYYDFCEYLFGEDFNISKKNNSPVSNTDSSIIRKSEKYEIAYQELKKIESINREFYVKCFLNFLNSQPEKLKEFLSDMINKTKSGKSLAHKLIVFNHSSSTYEIINSENIESLSNSSLKPSGKFSLKNDFIRITFSWQNGVGLNNPTIRVFII